VCTIHTHTHRPPIPTPTPAHPYPPVEPWAVETGFVTKLGGGAIAYACMRVFVCFMCTLLGCTGSISLHIEVDTGAWKSMTWDLPPINIPCYDKVERVASVTHVATSRVSCASTRTTALLSIANRYSVNPLTIIRCVDGCVG